MYEALKIHAIKDVWCSPEQDKQAVLLPARISRPNGVTGSVRVMLDIIQLPTLTDEYHVYQIGQIPTPVFGIELHIPDTWTPLEDICNNDVLQTNIYTNDGKEYPKCLVYAMLTTASNMIIAVHNTPMINNLRNETLFIRFYSNAFEASERSSTIPLFMETNGKVIENDADKAEIFNKHIEHRIRVGDVRTYHNGYLTDLPTMGDVKTNDTLEVVYDAGVHKVLDFAVKDLPFYESTLDNVRKYLVHPKKDDLDIDSIFYRDDIDVYLIERKSGKVRGVYLHHNLEHSVRMLTHHDYGIPTGSVEQHALALGVPAEDCYIRMYFRNSGYERPTVDESSFIRELYKLTDEEIIEAMTSTITSTAPWHAENLEQSNYTKLMRSNGEDITGEQGLNAFGYNASADYLMGSPQRVTDGETINTPNGYLGEMLHIKQDYQKETLTLNYYENKVLTLNQDMRSGIVDYRLSSEFNRETVHLDERIVNVGTSVGFQCYRAVKRNGVMVGDWVDVTDTADFTFVNGKVSWQIEANLYFTAVVAGDFSAKESYTVPSIDNVILPLMSVVTMKGTDVPAAEELVFVDSYLMIEDLDYFKSGNGYVITNKSLVQKPGERTITIIKTGMSNNKPRSEYGFVKYASLSRNQRFDIHEGMLVHARISGRIVAKGDITFTEAVVGRDMQYKEGSPYLLNYYRGPIRDIPWAELKVERELADQRVSTLQPYLHARLPEPTPTGPVTIEQLYSLYSPFLDRIIEHMNNGQLVIPPGRITNDALEVILQDYLPLLEYEPSKSNRYDASFVVVHPTSATTLITVEAHEYAALIQIIDHWLSGAVNLTEFVGIK